MCELPIDVNVTLEFATVTTFNNRARHAKTESYVEKFKENMRKRHESKVSSQLMCKCLRTVFRIRLGSVRSDWECEFTLESRCGHCLLLPADWAVTISADESTHWYLQKFPHSER